MYKMKDVCQMTGLTEKAIRLYMEQKLVTPRVEDGIHRKAYFFDEKDVERLKDIAALRSAGFALADIKMMLDDPANISRLVEEKEALLAMEIEQKKSVQEVLKHLTIEEHSNVTKLADAIEPRTTYAKETKRSRLSREVKWSIAVLIFASAMLFQSVYAGIYSITPMIMAFGIVFGPFAIVMGIRYFLHANRYKKLDNRGIGRIVSVVTNEKIDEFLEVEEMSILKELGTFLLLGFLGEIWKRIRLDAYHPVIQYQTQDGESHTATVKHGGFKKSWHVGDEVEIAWENGKDKLVYICKDKVLRKKAIVHLILGLIVLGASLTVWCNVLERNGWLDEPEAVVQEPRELTEEEISSLMDHIKILSSLVDGKKESFLVEDLTGEEIMKFAHSYFQTIHPGITMSGGGMRDIAKSYFDRKVPEDDIMCACGEVLVHYDYAGMKYDVETTHSHDEEEVVFYSKYEDSYFDGLYYTITVEKYLSGQSPEEVDGDLCTYTFVKYNDSGLYTSDYTLIGCEFH